MITAAGVTAGIDMALHLVAREVGPEVAQAIQLGIEYDPDPPFDSGSPEKAPAGDRRAGQVGHQRRVIRTKACQAGFGRNALPLAEEADRVAEAAEQRGVLPAEPGDLLEVEAVARAEQVAVGGAQLLRLTAQADLEGDRAPLLRAPAHLGQVEAPTAVAVAQHHPPHPVDQHPQLAASAA